jgi:hypothetical protein
MDVFMRHFSRSGPNERTAVFMLVFAGTMLQSKLSKIAEAFGAHVYPCPGEMEGRASGS